MPRLREILAASLACGACLWVSSTSLQAQPAPPPAKVVAEPEPSPLLVEPKTPEETFSATLLMVDLARLDLARKYLEQFEAASPDDDLLVKLRARHGTGAFVRLSRIKDLQPLSTQLLDKLNVASRKQSEDPNFVDGLIAKLSGDPTQRELATVELRNAGARAVPQILKIMRQPEMAAKQDAIVIALTRMGRQVVPALIGGLEAPEERVRAAIFGILDALDAREAIPYLWYPAFSEDEPMGVRVAANRTLNRLVLGDSSKGERLSSIAASNELRRLAKMLYENSALLPRDDEGRVVIWGWDETEQTVVARKYSPQVASMLMSTRFASQSLALSPAHPEAQRQYLAALLALEILQQGWDKPREAVPGSAMYLAVTAGEETVSQVLAEALAADQPSTAVAALEVLSQIGTREQLSGAKGLKSPVLAALNAPDLRVQFAAATAILRIEPRTAFSGSGRVVSILSRALTDPGRSRVVIIDADATRASQLAGYTNEMGYEPVVVLTGREGFEQAASQTAVDLVLVHVNCIRWDLTQTLANLRADSRTAAIPVAVFGSEDTRAAVARLVNRSKPSAYIADSGSATDFRRQLGPFVRSAKSPPLSAQERQQQKATAAYWLAAIATGRGIQIFDVSKAEKDLAGVAESPDVAANVLVTLSYISTAGAQRRLSHVALNPQLDPALRQTAALQLNYHIQRFGLLLTKDEVAEIQSGWTTAEEPAVKTALATVIGTLRPNATLVGERLRQFPSPTGRTP